VKNYVRRCAEQSNTPPVKHPLLQQALRYKGLMNAGYTIKPSDTPAKVQETILLLENEINSYKKKQQKKIEKKMKQTQRGL